MPHLTLTSALRHPRTQMRRFAAEPPTLSTLPVRTWAGLVGIAVGGSAIYGASLSLRFPRWRPISRRAGAPWMTNCSRCWAGSRCAMWRARGLE